MRILPFAAALVATALLLPGCTTGDASPTATPTATQATAAFDETVVPDAPATLDEDSAGTEAVRLADAIQALIPTSAIVYVDDHAQYVEASEAGAAYYGVIRTVSLEAGRDAEADAASIIATLESSGWTQTQTTDEGAMTLTALVSSLDAAAWFVLVGGDNSGDQPAISLQLASPDLP
jgi:hypothetical protein